MSESFPAMIAFREGFTDRAEELSGEDLARARTEGDALGEVEALCMLARIDLRRDDLATAATHAAEADRIAAALDPRDRKTPLHLRASIARLGAEFDLAAELYAESIALRESDPDADSGEVLEADDEALNLGHVQLRRGEFDDAAGLFARYTATALRRRGPMDLPLAGIALAALARARGDDARCARLVGAVQAELSAVSRVLDPDDSAELAALEAHLSGRFGVAVVALLCDEGAAAGIAVLVDQA